MNDKARFFCPKTSENNEARARSSRPQACTLGCEPSPHTHCYVPASSLNLLYLHVLGGPSSLCPGHTVIFFSDVSGGQTSQVRKFCLKAGGPSASRESWHVVESMAACLFELPWGPVESWNIPWCFLGWIFLFYWLTLDKGDKELFEQFQLMPFLSWMKTCVSGSPESYTDTICL